MLLTKKVNIYTQLANKYNLPTQVVEVICNSPFKFAKEIISKGDDPKPIMFAYLFKLKLKKKYNETNKVKSRDSKTDEGDRRSIQTD